MITDDYIRELIITARLAEKAKLIATMSPTTPNLRNQSRAETKMWKAKEALTRHLADCANLVKKRTVDKKSPARR